MESTQNIRNALEIELGISQSMCSSTVRKKKKKNPSKAYYMLYMLYSIHCYVLVDHRIIELLRLEKTLKIIKSNCNLPHYPNNPPLNHVPEHHFPMWSIFIAEILNIHLTYIGNVCLTTQWKSN